MAHRFNAKEGAKARRVKGVRRAHATMRAQGRVPAAEACIAAATKRMQRRLQRALDAAPPWECNALYGYTDSMDGEY